jgi:hypothetical protein
VFETSRDREDKFLMARACETPFDDLDPFAVLRPEEIAGHLGVTGRSVRRAIARGELKASRACGLRVLAADAAAWWKDNVVVRVEPDRPASRPPAATTRTSQLRPGPRPSSRFARGSAGRGCRCRLGVGVPDGAQADPGRHRGAPVGAPRWLGASNLLGAVRRAGRDSAPAHVRLARGCGRLPGQARSAKRWRPDELRQEQGGRQTLGEFFDEWWVATAMVELKRSTLAVHRSLWHAHAEPRLGDVPLRDIDARRVVAFRGELLAAGVGVHSVVKTLSMLQRVFGDAVEYGDVAFNPFKAVKKPTKGPSREAQPLTPLQVERLAADISARGYGMSAVLVRLMAYTGLRPQEALGLHWYAVRDRTLLVELANADGELDRLKNRKRSRTRSRTSTS